MRALFKLKARSGSAPSKRLLALVDLDGVWHGTEGGWGYGVPGEKDGRETLENTVLNHLRSAPEGTFVAIVDIHFVRDGPKGTGGIVFEVLTG